MFGGWRPEYSVVYTTLNLRAGPTNPRAWTEDLAAKVLDRILAKVWPIWEGEGEGIATLGIGESSWEIKLKKECCCFFVLTIRLGAAN